MIVNRTRPSLDASHDIITKIVLQKLLLIFGKICHIEDVRFDSLLQPQMIQTKAGVSCENGASKIFLFHVSFNDTNKCYA